MPGRNGSGPRGQGAGTGWGRGGCREGGGGMGRGGGRGMAGGGRAGRRGGGGFGMGQRIRGAWGPVDELPAEDSDEEIRKLKRRLAELEQRPTESEES